MTKAHFYADEAHRIGTEPKARFTALERPLPGWSVCRERVVNGHRTTGGSAKRNSRESPP